MSVPSMGRRRGIDLSKGPTGDRCVRSPSLPLDRRRRLGRENDFRASLGVGTRVVVLERDTEESTHVGKPCRKQTPRSARDSHGAPKGQLGHREPTRHFADGDVTYAARFNILPVELFLYPQS